MQTAEQVKQKLIELEKNYRIEHNLLIEEYKKLSPIQIGDKVKVTDDRGVVELGECIGFDDWWVGGICPIIRKLKKDGTLAVIGRIYLYSGYKLEKL